MSFDTDFDADFDGPARSPVEQLIEALRSPLPPGFEWDFRGFETCACGLANLIGIDLSVVEDAILRDDDALWPFKADEINGVVPLYGVPARDVTPQMVADALERLVNSRAEG